MYIDVLPFGDYHKGALIYYDVDGDWTFGSTCAVLDNTCTTTSDATCRNATKAGGSCSMDATDTTKQTLIASFNSLYKAQSDTVKTYYRISASISNPVFFDSVGSKVNVIIQSKNVFRKYESGSTSATIFTTSTITLTDKKYTVFWGLVPEYTAATSATSNIGCPITIY